MKEKMVNIYNKYREVFKNNRRKAILVMIAFVSVLIVNIFTSYSYYHDENAVSIVHSQVGAILGDNDIVLLIYTENGGVYRLTNSIPTEGYTFASYHCANESPLFYDDTTKKTTVITEEKEICSVYFDISG